MGQFATPSGLATEILQYAREETTETLDIRFLDPAFGTGSFYSAFLDTFPDAHLSDAVGYEIDPHYGLAAAELWSDTKLDIRLEDFTHADIPFESDRFNLLICNPPYVRHHHIASLEKHHLRVRTQETAGVEINGLAGLYCYFLVLCHQWMSEDGLAGWLIPSEFMDVNYGAALKRYLLDKVTLTHIHRYDPDDVQFGDALVSSTIVWFRKQEPPQGHKVQFTYGGSLLNPDVERHIAVDTLRHDSKWTRYPAQASKPKQDTPVISDFFDVKRGLATGSNKFFILSISEIERRGLPVMEFRPILPSPRYVPTDEIAADERGNPVLERQLFLLDCRLPEEVVKVRHPMLWDYLEEGKAQGVADRYICRHRKPWYAQEHRPTTSFLCTYLGRHNEGNGRTFRFLLNHSQATASNVYLMLYPKEPLKRILKGYPQFARHIWGFLRKISSENMIAEGRVYGGGLHKLEPRELGNVSAAELADLIARSTPSSYDRKQLRLLERSSNYLLDNKKQTEDQ